MTTLTDALVQMEKAMKRDNIETNDRQLACARIKSVEGQDYLKAMAAAANFAWVNRSSMTFLCRQVSRMEGEANRYMCVAAEGGGVLEKRFSMAAVVSSQAFAKQFKMTPDDLDMHVIYDVSHNIAKTEEHMVDGKQKTLLVHRKVSPVCAKGIYLWRQILELSRFSAEN